MLQNRPISSARRHATSFRYLTTLFLTAILPCITLAATPALAVVEETLSGPPDATPLSPHVQLPDLGAIPWPLDCSAWPESPPAGGYLASIFGHRLHGGGTDFHRGMDLRCDAQGDTCCERPDGTIHCEERVCAADEVEVPGAPIYALVAGVVKDAHDGANNNLIVETVRPSADLTVGATACDTMYIWYQHMRTTYEDNPATGAEWAVGDTVPQGAHLGWQGKSGASSVHLHLSTRFCTNSRADGDPAGTLDPEMNPFQLIGSDDGLPPEILALSTAIDGADLVVTIRIETGDPDFDQLEISVYDAPDDERHVRRLGYDSRDGIDVAGNNLDTPLLQPGQLSELTAIDEPDPPVATSGFTLTARFPNLNLAADPNTRVQVKVADVFGNTAIQEIPIFGDAEIGDRAWSDDDGDGLQDAGEPGLAGAGVELYTAAGVLIDSAVTDAQGNYGFAELIPGDYFLRFLPPSGYGATVQVQGFPDLDSDIDPQTRETAVFTLASGQTDLSLDAGFTSACFDVALVSYASAWRTTGTYAAGWNDPSFDDSGWNELLGDLGFGTSSVYSTIPESGLTSYFRLEFDLADVTLFDTFDLALYRDDGAVVYLNGVEVMRSNLPAGTVDENTPASSHSRATETATLPASHLVTGTNVLAVEVHNRGLGSDQVFDLELRSPVCRACLGEVTLTAGAGTFLDGANQTTVQGADDEIKVDGSPERSGLLAWDLTGLPADADVLHAELVVEVTDKSSDDFRIFAISRAWDEASADWSFASGGPPAIAWETAGANGTSDHAAAPLGLVSLPDEPPVTGTVVLNVRGRARVRDWIAGTVADHGLMIHGDAGQSNGLRIRSDDSADAPRLRLVYASGCSH